jgi:hypothetical protein
MRNGSRRILFLFALLLQVNLIAQSPKDSYSPSSVLSTGKWFKIGVTKDGIYRIDFSKLRQMGLADPSNPRIFGNNFGPLSFYNDDPKPDDLSEISIYENKGADGIFNEGDYLLFYGMGTSRWKYNPSAGDYYYYRHDYCDTAFYFITSGTGSEKLVSDYSQPATTPSLFSTVSDALFTWEQETENLLQSGREWYQPISTLTGISIDPGLSDVVTTEKMKYSLRVLARAPISTQFRLYEGSTLHQSVQVDPVNMLDYTGTYAQITDSAGSVYPHSSSPSFLVKFYNNGEAGAKGWLDYLRIKARSSNVFTGVTRIFSDAKVVGPGNITQFTFVSHDYSPKIWDISDPANPRSVQYVKTADNIVFKARTDSLRQYILFNESNALTPLFQASSIANQNLHASGPADMIIVTYPLFRSYAEKLAEMHYQNSGLVSMIVTPAQIYNEFSAGTSDICAIRNFIRMKYTKQKGTAHPLKYLLLFGDGSYENRTPPPANPDFIPTYQSQNSTVVVSSFTSDDFYGLLDNGEGEADGTEDIGIGRFPVSDTTKAGIIIRKIARYMAPGNNGNWKNVVTLVADDEDGNAHMYDAEGLSKLISDSVPEYNIDKIYLDAFRQVTTSNGQTYPDVENAINDRINAGCLIFNYIGHGNETGLAHERVVKTDDINSWNNGARLPLFITATCEFSRFDDGELNIITGEIKEKESAGEMVLLNENGGGIALMSTTRVVYSAPNYFLNRNIYNYAFRHDSEGNALTLGEIIKLAKNNSGSGYNKRNFLLLGDPALRLAFPWHGKVITDSINHVAPLSGIDTLKALNTITVSGHIEDTHGKTINDFNGSVTSNVYDKVSEITTLANDGGLKMKFDLRNNILFSGKTTASEGKFKFTFIVPRDIDYTFGTGKISYYANSISADMNGYFSDIVVGGFSNNMLADTNGPVIRLFMNDTLFRDGGITDESPSLLAMISDNGGINTAGSGIGHDIIAWFDNDRNNSVVLNNYFENDFNTYTSGKLKYALSGLSSGNHTITLKAWDNFNNSSEKSIRFVVLAGGRFVLKNIMNYPNPFTEKTTITAGHNRPDEKINVTVSIFGLDGRVIKIIKTSAFTEGYNIAPVEWDGTTESGARAGRGMYHYRITAISAEGELAEGTGRLIIL